MPITSSARAKPRASLPRFQALAFSELETAWAVYTHRGRDFEAVRRLIWCDRYFLLVKMLARRDAWHPWVYARCREVEAAPDGYLDIWAREHYKSTIITFAGIIQEILRDPEITVGLFSHTKPIAKGFLAQIKRELEMNADLKALFPEILYDAPEREADAWSLDAGIIVKRRGNPKEATVEAWGLVDGQPTSKHFRLRVYDDVVTKESVNTPEQILKTTEAWELSDNLGTAGGRREMVGTRYHFADTYAEIIKRGAVKLRHHPATEDGTFTGKPVLWSLAEWKRRVRDQGEQTCACQHLGNPLAGSQRMFNITDLQVYEVRPRTLSAYLLCDPGRSKKKDSAHTAMVVAGIDSAGNKYLLDGFDHKMDLMERWRHFAELYDKWIDAPGVVQLTAGYEAFGAQADLDYFRERQRLEGRHFEIIELAWPNDGEGSKVDRVQRLGPDIRGHRLYLPYPTEEGRLTKLQRQMLAAGYGYRIAAPIRRLDPTDQIVYDVTERLTLQIEYFPFGSKKDLIDALARLYDAEPAAPQMYDQASLEPEIV
jgi:hypothetical protein